MKNQLSASKLGNSVGSSSFTEDRDQAVISLFPETEITVSKSGARRAEETTLTLKSVLYAEGFLSRLVGKEKRLNYGDCSFFLSLRETCKKIKYVIDFHLACISAMLFKDKYEKTSFQIMSFVCLN